MGLPELRSYIGGEWSRDGSPSDDLNPSKPEEPVALVHLADAAAATAAATCAGESFGAWRAMPAPSRGSILRSAADLLEARKETVATDLSREEGKTVVEALGEVQRAVDIFRYFAGQTLEPDGETYPSHSVDTWLIARREPVGVVLAITPWNFPIAIPAWKIAPALAYGNAVVWKPAELVPLTAVHLMQVLSDAGLPPGTLNLVLGKGSEVGDALVEHPSVDAITFTGSNAVGRAIQTRATASGKKIQLELGGKNPAVVLADADLDIATEHVARGAFLSAGQKCTATSRVIVEEQIAREFTERLVNLAKSWKVGDALDPGTKVGPLVSEGQLETVMGYVRDDSIGGGCILSGGARAESPGTGYFLPPTVITGADPGSRVVREEVFGPVATVLEARDYDAAVTLANDTPYGLSASIFTRSLSTALGFAQDIQAGVVKINQESAGLEFQVPFGGMKESSSGSREQGKVAREFFTQWKTIYINP